MNWDRVWAVAATLAAVALGLVVLLDDSDGSAGPEGEPADLEPAPASAANYLGELPPARGKVSVTLADDPPPNRDCAEWTPAAFAESGVDVGAVKWEYTQVVDPGRVELTAPLGDPAGYASLAEADAVAAGAVNRGQNHALKRWVVLEHGGRYYAFEGVNYQFALFGFETVDENGLPGDYSIVQNTDAPPCRITAGQARLVGLHALAFELVPPNYNSVAYIAYDWSEGADGQIRVLPL